MKKWLLQLIASFRAPSVRVSAASDCALVAAPAAAPAAALAAARAAASPAAASMDSMTLSVAEATPPARLETADIEVAFMAWLVERRTDSQAPLGAREQLALLQLDRLAAEDHLRGQLLPRAAAIVPRLLAQLRGPATALSELSQLVSRDMTLVAEVIRMANSARYRRQSDVIELDEAIRLLGFDGLRFAIAKTVLRPLMAGHSGALSTRAAPRLWQHTDGKAQLAAVLARNDGLDPFDGYLLALAHNAAWSAVLRTLDSLPADGAAPWQFSAVFAQSLSARRDRLLGVVARQWQLTDQLTDIATEVGKNGLAAKNGSAPVRRLCMADHLANLLCTQTSAMAEALAEPLLASLPNNVRQTYLALAREPQQEPDNTAA